jgi:hypothetical protein
MTRVVFPARVVVAARPDDLPAGVAMVAPRPLAGLEAVLHPAWGWVGQVILDATADARHVTTNRWRDARVVVWIEPAALAAVTRERLAAEYDPDLVAGLDDDVILEMADVDGWEVAVDIDPVTHTIENVALTAGSVLAVTGWKP